jgi:hypothetical protein
VGFVKTLLVFVDELSHVQRVGSCVRGLLNEFKDIYYSSEIANPHASRVTKRLLEWHGGANSNDNYHK